MLIDLVIDTVIYLNPYKVWDTLGARNMANDKVLWGMEEDIQYSLRNTTHDSYQWERGIMCQP